MINFAEPKNRVLARRKFLLLRREGGERRSFAILGRGTFTTVCVGRVGWKPEKCREREGGRKNREGNARVRYTLITWIVPRLDFRESSARFNVYRVYALTCARETRTDRKND